MPRKTEFIPDGVPVRATPLDMVTTWMKYTKIVSAKYALGTGLHESDFAVNEKDTEVFGFVSKGIYQVSDEEAKEVGLPDEDLLTLEGCSKVFARLSENRMITIIKALPQKWVGTDPPPFLNAYLFIAHNQGLSRSLDSIRSFGMDWPAYKKRNLESIRRRLSLAKTAGDMQAAQEKMAWWMDVFAYGDDVESGSKYWTADFDLL